MLGTRAAVYIQFDTICLSYNCNIIFIVFCLIGGSYLLSSLVLLISSKLDQHANKQKSQKSNIKSWLKQSLQHGFYSKSMPVLNFTEKTIRNSFMHITCNGNYILFSHCYTLIMLIHFKNPYKKYTLHRQNKNVQPFFFFISRGS